jgi:hypothetical protein
LPIIGIDGAGQVIGVPLAGFTAWVSAIDAKSFAEALEQNMENLDWLAEATLRHQRAVTAIAHSAPRTLLPTRFGVVFSALAALEQDIRTRGKDLARAATKVEGCEEWGVKVFQAARPTSTIFKTASSGSDYLRKKAAALDDGSGPDESIRAFSAELQKVARDAAQSGKVSSGQKGLQWQATFLVPRAKRKQWDNVLRKYAQHWGEERSIECTGPWPPYSFVTSDHA